MTKTLTEQWREGTLKDGNYYTVCYMGWSNETFLCNLYYSETFGFGANVKEVLAPVPDYGSLYNPNDGRIPVGLFTVLKLIKRDIERAQEYRNLTDLECGIKSQVVSLLKRWGWDLVKDEPVSNSDELPTEQVLNLQNMVEDECSRRCELETKCSQLEKRLEVSEKEHYRTLEQLRIATGALNNVYHDMKCWTFISKRNERVLSVICESLKEMESVK